MSAFENGLGCLKAIKCPPHFIDYKCDDLILKYPSKSYTGSEICNAKERMKIFDMTGQLAV